MHDTIFLCGVRTPARRAGYQARAERSFYKALHELERLQSLRHATTAPVPGPMPLPAAAPAPSPQPVEPLPLAAQNDVSTEPRALVQCGVNKVMYGTSHPGSFLWRTHSCVLRRDLSRQGVGTIADTAG